jgi:hypothetical protein
MYFITGIEKILKGNIINTLKIRAKQYLLGS